MTDDKWDTAARRAVEAALKRARWDEGAKTITVATGSRTSLKRKWSKTRDRETLRAHLQWIAYEASHANLTRDGGRAVVESAMAPYAGRIDEVFSREK